MCAQAGLPHSHGALSISYRAQRMLNIFTIGANMDAGSKY